MKKILQYIFGADSIASRLILITVYCLLYDYMYNNFVYYFFYYMGISESEMLIEERIIWLLFSIVPMVFYHKIESVSLFISLFIYLFVYIPFIHALFITPGIGYVSRYDYSIVLCFFFLSLFRISLQRPVFKNLEIQPAIPFKAIELTTLLLTVIFIALRAGSMHFVNILTESDLLYDYRADNSDSAANMGLIPYIQGWLGGAFFPFLLVCYLKEKKWLKGLLVLSGYMALFMVDMQKLTFFMPFFIIGLFFLLKTYKDIFGNILHSFIILLIISLSLLFYAYKDDEIIFAAGAIFFLRTVCVADWLSQYYLLFFQQNPYTYYSHISIVNAVTNGYPYNEPLGFMVSYGSQNANANFLLTDGLAAAGIIGVVIIGFIFYLLLHFLNSISYRYKKEDLYLVIAPAMSYFLNASLFTTMLTNGFFIVILMIIGSNNPLVAQETKNNDK